jgi:hypothetical protein
MRLFLLASFCLMSVHLSAAADDDGVVVKTEKGSIKGARKEFDNREKFYFQFLGIRYAKAPTGPLRFMVRHFFSRKLNSH